MELVLHLIHFWMRGVILFVLLYVVWHGLTGADPEKERYRERPNDCIQIIRPS